MERRDRPLPRADFETSGPLASISELLSGLIGARQAHRGLDRVRVFALEADRGILSVAAGSPSVALPKGVPRSVSLRPPYGPLARSAICCEEITVDIETDHMDEPDRQLLAQLGDRIRLFPLAGRRGLHSREKLDCKQEECSAFDAPESKCWIVSGTQCRDGQPRFPREKLEICLRCPAFGVVGVLATGITEKGSGPELNTMGMARLCDHIGALVESHLTTKALAKLNAELESRVNSAREELIAKNELLLRSEKLAVMGKLAAGLAHEINNPLSVISTSVQSLILGGGSAQASKRSMEMIMSEVRRISTLVRGLLNLSRERPLVLAETDLCALVRQSLELVSAEAQIAGVKIRCKTQTDFVQTMVDRSQLQQVLVNLSLNAIQAMTSGGALEVTVRTGRSESSNPRTVEIEFSDTGPGIQADILENVFDPFFSTKQESGGIGLGLSVSLSIVEKHHGTIIAESVINKGTVFTVVLPE